MNRTGQTLTEFLLGLGLITLTIAGSGWLLAAQWQQAKCAYLTFQRTRQALDLAGDKRSPEMLPRAIGGIQKIELRMEPTGVSGVGRCGTFPETVKLKSLESLRSRRSP